jgi:hypothetical protein
VFCDGEEKEQTMGNVFFSIPMRMSLAAVGICDTKGPKVVDVR